MRSRGGERTRVPGGHQLQRRVGNPARAHVPPEMGLFVGVETGLELLVGLRDVLDAHVLPERAVVHAGRDDLVARQPAPPIGLDPPFGHHHEGAEHVTHVFIADVVAAVHVVDAADRGTALLPVEAVLDDGVEKQCGVVVALLCAVRELRRLGEQPTDAGDGVCAVERQFQGPGEVPGEFVRGGEPLDLRRLLLRVHPPDLSEPLVTLHLAVPLLSPKLQLYVE